MQEAAQLSFLRLLAKLCHYYQQQLRPDVIHDGVLHRRLQLLLERLKEGLFYFHHYALHGPATSRQQQQPDAVFFSVASDESSRSSSVPSSTTTTGVVPSNP